MNIQHNKINSDEILWVVVCSVRVTKALQLRGNINKANTKYLIKHRAFLPRKKIFTFRSKFYLKSKLTERPSAHMYLYCKWKFTVRLEPYERYGTVIRICDIFKGGNCRYQLNEEIRNLIYALTGNVRDEFLLKFVSLLLSLFLTRN